MAKLTYIENLRQAEHHAFDNYTNLGYDYKQNIMKNVLSPEMFANPLNDVPYRQIERMIEFLVDQVKRIKLEYNFTLPKNSTKLN